MGVDPDAGNFEVAGQLSTNPYTRIAFVETDLNVSRLAATKYLDALAEGGFLQKARSGRANYYINTALVNIIQGA